MPKIEPEAGPAGWPANEGAIGVVGIAPWATLDFCRAVYALVDATKDWHFPRIIIDANTKIPSRGRHLELGERDPSPFIVATIAELAEQGAAVVAVPCNTAHILFDRWAADATVLVPNIVDVTAQRARDLGCGRVVPLSSRSIRRHRTYETALSARDIETAALSEENADLVDALIARVKLEGGDSDAARSMLRDLFDAARDSGADGVILGCTELSAVTHVDPSHDSLVVIDSNQELARATLVAVGIEPSDESRG